MNAHGMSSDHGHTLTGQGMMNHWQKNFYNSVTETPVTRIKKKKLQGRLLQSFCVTPQRNKKSVTT